MKYSELVRKLTKSPFEILESMTPAKVQLIHMASGISGEVAELLAEIIAPVYNKKAVMKEMGDIEFYLEGIFPEQSSCFSNYNMSDINEIIDLMVVESGLILEAVKKHVFNNRKLDNSIIETSHHNIHCLMFELYLLTNISRNEVLAGNTKKLTKRYGEVYSDKAADLRVDVEKVKV